MGSKGGQLATFDYLEAVTNDADPNDPLPMLVALHTRGQSPESLMAYLTSVPWPFPVRLIVPSGTEAFVGGRSWFGEPSELTAGDAAAQLGPFLDEIPRCVPTTGKPVVSGYSHGATVAYHVGAEEPDSVAAVMGAGGRLGADVGPIMVHTVVIHGNEDTVVPTEGVAAEASRRAVDEREPVDLRILPGVGHSFAGALQLEYLQAVENALADQRPG